MALVEVHVAMQVDETQMILIESHNRVLHNIRTHNLGEKHKSGRKSDDLPEIMEKKEQSRKRRTQSTYLSSAKEIQNNIQ
ncbi:hypothetical protein H5410_041735 [Solanum commersonii]|uniref:Uncharacterized protein n=1 Tax=Solanum commersonii TaxID=4109 RepID=A0A9J5XTQ7_SOLCO|nr:hypothetical protein H5410_041735 [Solanum commersonii]